MMITIRNYTSNDWPMVLSWWTEAEEISPLETMMPLNSSFIAEINGVPALAVCLYLTNTPDLAYIENFVGNPNMKGPMRKQASISIVDHIVKFARENGYKRLICMTEKPILVERYKELGFTPTLSGVTTFVRSTECPQQS